MDDYIVVGDPELAPDVPSTSVDASEVSYINTSSGLSATNVQGAIDEVTNKVTKGDLFVSRSTSAPVWIGADYNDATYGRSYAALKADNEGGNLRLSRRDDVAHIELDTYSMNGSNGYARLYLGKSGKDTTKQFRFNEDGAFYDGNNVNTTDLNKRAPIIYGLQLNQIVKEDSTVTDGDKLARYMLAHYFGGKTDKYVVATIWAVNRTSDSRHTACALDLATKHSQLSGIGAWVLAEVVFEHYPYDATLYCYVRGLYGSSLNQGCPPMKNWWGNSGAGFAVNTTLNQSSGWYLDGTNNYIKNLLHPVGTIIESTTCDTMAKVVAAYGGTTWIQHTGYVLRGATSGVTSGSALKTGGADSVSYTPSGSNSGGSVTNTTLTSTAQIPAHTHGSKTLTGTFYSRYYKGSATATGDADIVMGGSGIVATSNETWSGSHAYLQASSLSAKNPKRTKATITATHKHDSVGGTTAHGHGFTQPTFSGTAATINTLPNYKSVYIWERTA